MCFFVSFLPATIWLVIAFFVLFAATKAETSIGGFGRALGVWLLFIALMFPLVGAYMTISGACRIPAGMELMHPRSGMGPGMRGPPPDQPTRRSTPPSGSDSGSAAGAKERESGEQ